MSDTKNVRVTLEYSARELMSAVLDNLLAAYVPQYSWDEISTRATVRAMCPDTDEYKTYSVSASRLARGLSLALRDGAVSGDPWEWDAYDSYTVLQYALYGKLIYG